MAYRYGLTDFLCIICYVTAAIVVMTVVFVCIYIGVQWWWWLQWRYSSHHNLQVACCWLHTELAQLIFPVCPAVLLLASMSWQWCMYAFILTFFVNDDFNKGYLLIIIYKLLVGDSLYIWFDWFSSMPFHAAAGHIVMTVVYVCIFIGVHKWWLLLS